MVYYALSNAGGIGGRGRSTTAEDISCMNEFTKNYFDGGTNLLAADQPTSISTPHIDPFSKQLSATMVTGLVSTELVTGNFHTIPDRVPSSVGLFEQRPK
jgi:hypothetical protein